MNSLFQTLHANSPYLDRTVAIGQAQPRSLIRPSNMKAINDYLSTNLRGVADKSARTRERFLHCSLARSAACHNAFTLKWPQAREQFPRLPDGEDKDWSLEGFWNDIRGLMVAASMLHGVDMFVAWGTKDESGDVRGSHYSSPSLFENKQDDVLFAAFAESLTVAPPRRLPSSPSPVKQPRTVSHAVVCSPSRGLSLNGIGCAPLRGSSIAPFTLSPSKNTVAADDSDTDGMESVFTRQGPSSRPGGNSKASRKSPPLPPPSPQKGKGRSTARAATARMEYANSDVMMMVMQFTKKVSLDSEVRANIIAAFAAEDGELLSEAMDGLDENFCSALMAMFFDAYVD